MGTKPTPRTTKCRTGTVLTLAALTAIPIAVLRLRSKHSNSLKCHNPPCPPGRSDGQGP